MRRGVPAEWVAVIAIVAMFVGTLIGGVGTVAFIAALEGPSDAERWAGAGPVSERLPQRLPTLLEFVEGRMEAEFDSEPKVEILPDAQFEEAVTQPSDSQPQTGEEDDFAATAFALGLVDDADRFNQTWDLLSTGVLLGFYDPATDRLVVRGGGDWTPLMETTIVHELVHALQDQQTDLDSATRDTRADDESYLALLAIAEGQATVVEEDWLTAQDDEYRELHDLAYSARPQEPTPEPLADVLAALPYDLGWDAVLQLEDFAGRQAPVDVLKSPPTTLEQVWDVTRWRAGAPQLADAVAVPDVAALPETVVLDRGTLGVHLLSLLTLEDSDDWFWLEDGPIDGWAGDRYVTWKQRAGEADRICTRITVVLDDAEAATTFVEQLTDWARTGGAIVRVGERLDLQRCDTP